MRRKTSRGNDYDEILRNVLYSYHTINGRPISRQRKRDPRRLRRIALVAASILVVLGAFLWVFQGSLLTDPTVSGSGSHRAVLVDELSGTFPDSSFLAGTRSVLAASGYALDYYGPGDVTVSLLRDLPMKGYGIVILRAHSAAWTSGPDVAVFTSERYSSTTYIFEQVKQSVIRATLHDGKYYFAITPRFVSDDMHGSFRGSIVIMMGCSGLTGVGLAQAFLSRGASAFVGWDKGVSVGHTDNAILEALSSLANGTTVREAVGSASDRWGPDPFYHSHLAYYDSTIGLKQQSTQALLGLTVLLTIVGIPVLGTTLVFFVPRLFGKR